MIREASLDDMEVLQVLAAKFFKESTYTQMKYSPKKVEQMLTHAIITDHMCVYVAEDEESGGIVGFIGGAMMQPHFSEDVVAHEIAWFLESEHRNSTRYGILLLKRFETWATEKNCDVIHYSVLQSSPKGVVDLLQKNDCKWVEIGYQKKLKKE